LCANFFAVLLVGLELLKINVEEHKSDLTRACVALEVEAELIFAEVERLGAGDVFVLFFGKSLNVSLFANCRISQECDSQRVERWRS
jgi:hypothetical protein